MIDKRLMSLVQGSGRCVFLDVLLQWAMLAANIVLMYAISVLFSAVFTGTGYTYFIIAVSLVGISAMALRYILTNLDTEIKFLASRRVRMVLREKIYDKLMELGNAADSLNTAEIVQVSGEGVDQLEVYFSSYLPQFFYALIAPLTLFAVLLPVDWRAGLVLLVCVPLIPLAIIMVQKWAKKLLSKYWGQYTEMGDTFLENLQALTMLKVYQADEAQNKVMNEQAEKFRKITMRVLIMQLNSISVMDFVAYAGAAAGMIVAIYDLGAGKTSVSGCLLVILLAADFFLPMRKLGSFFHVAMNGIAASDRIFALLDREPEAQGEREMIGHPAVAFENVSLSYGEREVLKNISFTMENHGFLAIVGESGAGKSTLAALLSGRKKGYTGKILFDDAEASEFTAAALRQMAGMIGSHPFFFAGTVAENMGEYTEEEMEQALTRVRLKEFLDSRNGLATILSENASNLSGGQRQRLALARLLLQDTPVLVLDEATSSIDGESEAQIMAAAKDLAQDHAVIVISHRLKNVIDADRILVLEDGEIREEGTHEELLAENGIYAGMYRKQKELEAFAGGEA